MDGHIGKIEKTKTEEVPGNRDDVLRQLKEESSSSRSDTTENHPDTVLRKSHEENRIDVTVKRKIDGTGYLAEHQYKLEGRFLDLVKDGQTDKQYYRSHSLSDQSLSELKKAAKDPQPTRVHQLKYKGKLHFIDIRQLDKMSWPDDKGNRTITYTETTFRAEGTFYANELYGDK